MNILVTLNEAYIPCLEVMLRSLADSTPGQFFSVYLIETSVRDGFSGKTVKSSA